MLKRLSPLALGMAFGLVTCLVPLNAASGFGAGRAPDPSMEGVAQQQQPTSPSAGSQQQQMQQDQQQMEQMGQQQQQGQEAHHGKQSLLTGKILAQDGHYLFENNNRTLRISNPKKAKKYNGDHVQVKGAVNEQAQTIHISKIKPISS